MVDGNKFNPYPKIEHTCIVKGDSKFLNIAAASIIAKTTRDNLIKELANKFPNYGWKQNKGYPTKKHRIAISKYGITEHHRKSFSISET